MLHTIIGCISIVKASVADVSDLFMRYKMLSSVRWITCTLQVISPLANIDYDRCTFINVSPIHEQNMINEPEPNGSNIRVIWIRLSHIPFSNRAIYTFYTITFQFFKQLCLAKDHWRGFSTRNAHMVHIVNEFRIKIVYTSPLLYFRRFTFYLSSSWWMYHFKCRSWRRSNFYNQMKWYFRDIFHRPTVLVTLPELSLDISILINTGPCMY